MRSPVTVAFWSAQSKSLPCPTNEPSGMLVASSLKL